MKDDKVYRTSDLWLSAFFRVRGLKLLSVERENTVNKKVTFVFEENLLRVQLTKEFFNNALLGIQDIRSAMVEVKSAIFNF